MEIDTKKFEDKKWATNRRRRASTPEGAKLYANALWLSMPGSKLHPIDARPSMLIREMLEERRRKALDLQDPHWLWDAKTNSFTEKELLNIARELEKMENTIVSPRAPPHFKNREN